MKLLPIVYVPARKMVLWYRNSTEAHRRVATVHLTAAKPLLTPLTAAASSDAFLAFLCAFFLAALDLAAAFAASKSVQRCTIVQLLNFSISGN
jgi:hypothetical protein